MGAPMTLGRYLVGVALVFVSIVPIVFGAVRCRRRWLPEWSGALARLAEFVIVLASVIGASQAIGAVGLFRVQILVPLLVIIGCLLISIGKARGSSEAAVVRKDATITSERGPDLFVRLVAAGTTALVSGQWLLHTAITYREGTLGHDTLAYHLPHAAQFAKSGWLTEVHNVTPDFPNMFHPANGEVIHAVTMLWFDRDVLSPLVNLGWLALALLSAWCIGQPFGRGHLSLAAVAVVFSLPVFVFTQPGSADTDIPSAALLLTTVALLIQPGARRPATVLAAVAAGLGLGTKLTIAAPVAALTVGVFVLFGAARWRRFVVDWVLPLSIAGCYWFVRNLLATGGNPVPAVDLSAIGVPSPTFSIVEEQGAAVIDYAADTMVWDAYLIPGLELSYSGVWPLCLLLAAVGCVLGLVRPGTARVRAIAAATVVGVVVYLLTPTTAGGPEGAPVLFASNLRYLMGTLAVGAALVACTTIVDGRGRERATAAVLAGSMLATAAFSRPISNGVRLVEPWPREEWLLTTLVVSGMLALTGVFALRNRLTRPALGLGLCSMMVFGTGVGHVVQRFHYENRWSAVPLWQGFDATVRDERVAIGGVRRQYPFFGADLSNIVQYVGEATPHGGFTDASTCDGWVGELRLFNPTLVVLEPTPPEREAPQLRWTRSMEEAKREITVESSTVISMGPGSDDPACK